MLNRAYYMLLVISVELIVIPDSNDHYLSLATQRQLAYLSVCANANFIWSQVDFGNTDRICWIPGRLNQADHRNKPDGLFVQALQLPLFFGKLSFGFSELGAIDSKEKLLEYSEKLSIWPQEEEIFFVTYTVVCAGS